MSTHIVGLDSSPGPLLSRSPRANDEDHLRVELLHCGLINPEQNGVSAADVVSESEERELEWKIEMKRTHFKRERLGFNQSCVHWSIGIK